MGECPDSYVGTVEKELNKENKLLYIQNDVADRIDTLLERKTLKATKRVIGW